MTDLNEVSCRLIVMSTDKNLFEEFDVQPLQTLLANEPFKHFVHKKHFYTVESKLWPGMRYRSKLRGSPKRMP